MTQRVGHKKLKCCETLAIFLVLVGSYSFFDFDFDIHVCQPVSLARVANS